VLLMPRIRSIKPEIFISPQVMNLSRDARLLFIGLITQADDQGRGTADPRKLKSAIFGGDDDVTTARVLELLAEAEGQGLCVTYDANGQGHGRVYALPSFTEHQYIQRPKPSVYPRPPKQALTRASQQRISAISDAADTDIGGSDRIGSEGSDRSDLTRARAAAEEPVDNSGRRAPAPDHLKKTSGRKERSPQAASAILAGLAARAKS
jgi:hypothetical protein